MQGQESTEIETTLSQPNTITSTHLVTVESVHAEEVPTIPIESLETLSTLQPEVAVHSVASTRAVSVPVPLVVQPTEVHRNLVEWLQVCWDGIRPAYLPLAAMPVLVGTALAWSQTITPNKPLGQLHVTHLVGVLLAVVLLQMGANLVNDYYDYLRGIDTSNIFGPGGLIQQGLMTPASVLAFGLSALGIGTVIGLVVAIGTSPLLLLLGAVGVLSAYFYSATLRALSSLVLGELVAFLIFGPLLTLGAYVAQTRHSDPLAISYGISLGLLAVSIIHVNNMRDAEGDMHAGKRTFAGLLGLAWSRVLFVAFLLVAYALPVVLALPKGAPHLLLLVLWTLPTLVVAVSGVLRTDTPAGLHIAMRQTLKLETFFALLLCAAFLLSSLYGVVLHLSAHLPF